MNAYRIVFQNGRQVTAFGTNKAHAYRMACRKTGVPVNTLTRNIVAIPRPNIGW